MKLNYGFKQIAPKIGNYHPDHVRKIVQGLLKANRIVLKYWLGPKRRMVMDDEEIEEIKRNLRIGVGGVL